EGSTSRKDIRPGWSRRERSPIPTRIRLRWSRGKGRRSLQTFGSAGAGGKGRRSLQTFGSAGAGGEAADPYKHSARLEPGERSPIPTDIRLRWSRGRGRRFLQTLRSAGAGGEGAETSKTLASLERGGQVGEVFSPEAPAKPTQHT